MTSGLAYGQRDEALAELRRIAAECRRALTPAEAQRLAADGG